MTKPEAQFFKKNPAGSCDLRGPKNGPKNRFLGDFDKKLIQLHVRSILEDESTNSIELWSKNLYTNHNARFFKLHYLTNELIFCMLL